jgi:lipopolysaccharide transport system permease protein
MHRRLFPFFAHRLLQKFYIRTWLGWAWIPLRPIADVASRVLLFGALLGVPSGDRPYLIFFIVGMGAWQLFDRSVYWATRSIEVTRDIFRRLSVPRLPALVSAVVPSGVDYLMYVLMTAAIALYYELTRGQPFINIAPDVKLLAIPTGLLLLLALALSIGLWTSVLGARARDVRFGFSYVMGFWFFLTPVIYPASAIPEQFRPLVEANPATAPVQLVKYGLLDTESPARSSLVITLAVIGLLTAGGLWFFLRWERAAADSI